MGATSSTLPPGYRYGRFFAMDDFLSGYTRKSSNLEEDYEWAAKLEVKYPRLTAAMRGKEASSASGGEIPPMSFILSAKEGRLRFSLSSVDSSRSYSGPIDDPSEPLAAAERALEANRGEWWTKSTNGSRHR